MTKFITTDCYTITWEEAEIIKNALTIAFIKENDEEICEKIVKIAEGWEDIRNRLSWDKMAVLTIEAKTIPGHQGRH